MKQKIVIKISVKSDKCRKKAMKVAAVADGVTGMAFEGEDKNLLVVIGDGVDAASLTNTLRKKGAWATLETIEEVKPKPKDPPEEKPEENKEEKPEEKKPDPSPAPTPDPPCCPDYHQPQIDLYKVIYDPYGPTNSCTII